MRLRMFSYLRHVVHVSVPRPLLNCHRKHFRGLGGRPKAARSEPEVPSTAPLALCLRHRRRLSLRSASASSSIPVLRSLFLLSPLRGRPPAAAGAGAATAAACLSSQSAG